MTSRGEKARRKELAAARRRADAEAEANPRNCWCGPGDAYCGTCSVCGRPGHLRHFPGAAPVTGQWCDRHYWLLRVLHPNGAVGCWLWLAAVVAGVAWIAYGWNA